MSKLASHYLPCRLSVNASSIQSTFYSNIDPDCKAEDLLGRSKTVIEFGRVVDWDSWEKLFMHSWKQLLNDRIGHESEVLPPSAEDLVDQPCLFIDAPMAPRAERERLTTLAFERYIT